MPIAVVLGDWPRLPRWFTARIWTAAEDKVRGLLRDDPKNAPLIFVLGTILRGQERFDEALDAFMESEQLEPGFPETHNQISYLFYRTDDGNDALAEARTALSIDPGECRGVSLPWAGAVCQTTLRCGAECLREIAGAGAGERGCVIRHRDHGAR